MPLFSCRLRCLLLFGGLVTGLSACVEGFEPNLNLTADVLIVDGGVTDLAERQTVKLSRSRVYTGRSSTSPVQGAKVEILVGGATAVSLRESATTNGLYEAPDGFRGEAGKSYQLRFTTADGQRYESSAERLMPVPPMTKVYDQFDARGIVNAEKTRYTPANLIYIDTPDPAGERNFYRWNWTLWERQDWCATCQRGIYITTNGVGDGYCLTDPVLPLGNLYDYTCAGSCWEIVRGVDLNLFADTYSNGRPVTGKLVARIPYYQPQGALVEIRQQSLSPEAYRYYQLFESQTQSTGGLADTPPAPIVGNVRNLDNDRENVVGYFTASAVAVQRYWLNRQNASGIPVGLFQTLQGRAPSPEPPVPFRPPAARCLPSETRTPVKPEGWQP